MASELQSERRPLSSSFVWLNWTQFQGALNDNIFKLLVTFYLIRNFGPEHAARLSGLGGIIFALPFLLFVPAAGILADRYSKSRITVIAKFAEIMVMVTAAVIFWFGNPYLGFAVLFLMSTQSAFFGPTKYGIIPELVEPPQLSRANGYLVSLTYLSIIFGTVAAPLLTRSIVGESMEDREGSKFAIVAMICVVIAITGFLTSLRVKHTPAMGSSAKISILFWRDITRTLRENRHDRFLLLAILASAYFSLIGAFIQFNLIPFAIEHLDMTETDGGLLFLYAALGIGAGSLVAGRLSGRNIEFGMIPIGAMIIALSSALLFFLPYSILTTRILMFAAGAGAGLFIIPVEAFIQYRAPEAKRGSIIAANGFLSWMGVMGAGILVYGLSHISFWKPAYTFGLLGILTLLMTVLCLKVLPDFFVRFASMVLIRSIYKIRRVGLENLPREGGALLVANHVSALDALLILSSQQRRIRFLMAREIYETHRLRKLFDLMGVIPISENDRPRDLITSLQAAREQLDRGFMVCIFAEGALTRTGQMREFKKGMERIVKGTNYPIIPIYIGGVWGSRFSHYRSIVRGDKAPIKWRYPVTLVAGSPMPSEAKAWQVQTEIRRLSAQYYELRKGPRRNIGIAFVKAARKYGSRMAMNDTTGKQVTYRKALLGSIVLARHFRKLLRDDHAVGVVLPPSVGGTIVNVGLVLAGKVPVNLNFTTSNDAFQSSIKQAGIRHIITAKKLVEKVSHLEWPENMLFADKFAEEIHSRDKLVALVMALFCPSNWLSSADTVTGDELLTIMFSSGTTGEPKGVMLSHHNVLSNCEAITELFRPDQDTHLCATLPIFHSFGFTAGMFFPLLNGLKISYHASPLDTAKVVEVVKENRCNVFFTTPSFLSSYYRKAEPEEFASLKFVVVGAEKLKRQLADAFEQKFGVRPLEGYGTTEMSPVVALNLPSAEGGNAPQVGNRDGSIGQPLPGEAVKIVDPETGKPLEPGQAGMMLVSGPNRMRGYLHRPDLTEKALRDEWYVTGDIARMEEDGFIFITDRLFRFSKIGGEMVPHMAAEEVLIEALRLVDISIAITAVPDERKGEQLVLLYTEAVGSPEKIREILDQSNLPNLWRPSSSMMFRIEKLPLTSTGKVDVRQLKEIAYEFVIRK